jgi:hypothetical protein
VQHLAQRRHRRANRAGPGPLCARRGDLRWHRRDRWLQRNGAVIRDLGGHRRDRWLRWGGAVRRWARPGSGRTRIRAGCEWFGHDVFPWQVGARRSALGDRWLAAGRNAATDGWAGGRNHEVAGIHRVTAARPGSARQLPSGTGIVSRDAALRASWAPTIVMTASVRICSSGSPGKLAAGGG